MVKYSIILIVSCIIIVLIASVFFFPDLPLSFFTKSNKGTIAAETSVEIEQSESGKDTNRESSGTITNSGVNTGDSSGDVGSPSGGFLGIGCDESQISYALKNLTTLYETCNYLNSEICESKSIGCSLYVQNLDNNISGTFYIDFYFFDASLNNENAFDIVSINNFVPANSLKVFEASTTITSSGEEGIANQDLSCSFLTNSIPTREVC